MVKIIKKNSAIYYLILIFLPIVIGILCMCFGRYSLSISEILKIIFSPFTSAEISDMQRSVIFGIRLPRVILAVFVGAAMSVSGVAFQSLFTNPLATPDTLGVSSGASFGAVIALMLRMDLIGVQLMALLFGIIAVVLSWSISKIKGSSSIIMIVLSGMVISALFEALISLLKYVADPEEVLPTITYWLMGSLASVSYKNLCLGLPMITVGVVIIYLLRWKLNILSLTEDEAKSMGLDIKKMRLVVILASTMITASTVSMCGKIGWIGLLIPHICRMVAGSNNKYIVSLSISFGAVFVLIIDTLARTMTQAEIPISILTAIIGAPFFISLLRKTGGAW